MATTTTGAATYAAHIERLCKEHGITFETRQAGGRAWRRSRRISVRPIRSAVTYAVALHEIGHIVGANPPRRLDAEAAAWTWARANAIEWTPRMESRMAKCLESYAKWFLGKTRRGVNVAPSAAFDLLRGDALTMSIPAPLSKYWR